MDVEIDLGKSLEQNASDYFEKSKLAKKKLKGLERAALEMQKKVSRVGKAPEGKKLARKRKRQWFEAFHWFRTSQGFLIIGGKDAKSNETVVKRHLEQGDFFLHADIQGGSACVVKAEGKEIPEETLEEAAHFAASRSKAWQQQLASVDVYAVPKEQVSKKAPSGEALGTGAFMIYGKRKWFRKTPLEFAVGLASEGNCFLVIAGPPSAVKKHAVAFAVVSFGKEKRSDVAKAVLRLFEAKAGEKKPVPLDEIISALPGESLKVGE